MAFLKKILIFFLTYFFLSMCFNVFQQKLIIEEYIDEVNVSFKKANACIIIMLRNEEINNLVDLIQRFELVFNKNYKYPYILFNNEEFTNSFRNEIVKHTNSTIEFGLIPREHWDVPTWINKYNLKKSLLEIGHSIAYRQMCRFNSGFFFRHELTLKYQYYMRLDLDSKFPCQIKRDPFEIFRGKEEIKYGFILSYYERIHTIKSLWVRIKEWKNKSLKTINKNSAIKFISDDNGNSLNRRLCIFYNNFEMADFSVFRNESYLNYFDNLDKSGGFFYERWVNYYFIIANKIN